MTKETIVAKNKTHLSQLIKDEIRQNGDKCDLNHIDVSQITNMSVLFKDIDFNGDISQWNTSRVTEMKYMFVNSKFNQSISCWDVSKVKNMSFMFYGSKFNQNISKWDVSNVEYMPYMFSQSSFSQDISSWRPIRLINKDHIFKCSSSFAKNKVPYWVDVNIEFLEQTVNAYQLQRKLNMTLEQKLDRCNVIKI